MPKVSVIVPVYNVEKYIERCVRSLFEQTLDDIEYIFVNDCTPDNSITILENILNEYPNRQSQVKIIHHAQNQGQAGARTTGMKAMTGDFMIHCDPDDWVELDMYETMYNKAVEANADIVTCGIFIETNTTTSIVNITHERTGQASLLKFKFFASLWFKLIHSDLIKLHKIAPYYGIDSGEDLNVSIRAYYYAKNIIDIEAPLYHYNKTRFNSITNSNIKIRIEKYALKNITLITNFLQSKSGNKFDHVINFIKWRAKYELLEKPHRDLEYWSSLWNECHKDIPKFGLSWKQQIIFQLFSNYPRILNIYFKYLDWRITNN